MKSDISGFWKMPPAIAGTNTNNVLTKAMDSAISSFEDAVADAFESELDKRL
jgi:hypothetical protein